MKKQKFSRAYLYETLFVSLTIVLAIVTYMYPDFVGAMWFAELLAAQIFTRHMVMFQMHNFELSKAMYPQAACLSVSGIVILTVVKFISFMEYETSHSFWEKAVVSHIIAVIVFTLIYFSFTRRDRKKSKNLARMSKSEIEDELCKIRQAQRDIERAEHILEQSPLY